MDASAITALAALMGAAVGGLSSVCANWLTQRTQLRAHWRTQELVRRQDLYKEFIEDASRCYVHALQHDEPDVPTLVSLYAKLGRMRLVSSPEVLASAHEIERRILDTYLAPDKTFLELRDMVHSGSIDLMREFSAASRREYDQLRGHEL